jgi:hypothetical protein
VEWFVSSTRGWLQLAEQAAVPELRAVGADETAPRRRRAPWLIYAIAFSAIALPALVLVCVSSIPAGHVEFRDLRTGAGRGEFLIPVLILCAESVRCWLTEVTGGAIIRFVRLTGCAICFVTGVVCFAATVIAAATAATAASSRSLVGITIVSMIIAAAFGLAALIVISATPETS